MRRLTIELNLEELTKFEGNPMLQSIKSFEILQFLKDGPEEFAVICKVEFKDEGSKIEDLIDDEVIELQMLDHPKERVYTYFLRSKPSNHQGEHASRLAGGYLSVPFEINDGKARMTYLGSGKQVKSFLETIEKTGIKYRVVSITDAKFSLDSPLSRLTEKQRRVLVMAYRLGYYDEPRKISSQELGERLKIGSSTLVEHRRRAERLLLAELIGG